MKIKEVLKKEIESFKKSNDYKTVTVALDVDPI